MLWLDMFYCFQLNSIRLVGGPYLGIRCSHDVFDQQSQGLDLKGFERGMHDVQIWAT